MKKAALIIALLMLVLTVAAESATKYDKEFLSGLKSYNSKNYKAAVKQFKEYIARKPDPTAYYLAGYSLYKLGKFSEADEYFRDAFLIDPEFSLEKVGLIKKANGQIIAKEQAVRQPEAAGETKPSPQPAKQSEPAAKTAAAAKPGQPSAVEQKPKGSEPGPAPAQKPSVPGQQVAPPPPPPPAAPAPAAPSFPAPATQMPDAAAPALLGLFAAFGMVLFVIWIAFYIYFCLCLFLIAKKLDVPAPWTAWIPLVQIWTIVASAGKPGWWILLLFVPLVNAFVGIYLWICITENLGRNKWLGLLMLVPIANMILLGMLAFSKSESHGMTEALPE